VAPVAHSILQEFHVDDMPTMLLSQDSEDDVACYWVRNNTQKWLAWMPDASEDACNKQHYRYAVHDCAGPTREVSFHWDHPSAADPTKADDCVGGSLPATTHVNCDYVDKHGSSVRILRAFHIICFMLCAAALAMLICMRHHAMFARSQPWLLMTMVMGCFLLIVPGFVEDGPWTTFKCSAHNLFRGIGTSIIIACHIVKTRHYILMAQGSRLLPGNQTDARGRPRRVTKGGGLGRRNSSMLRLTVHNMIRGVQEPGNNQVAAAKGALGQVAGTSGVVGQTSQEFNTTAVSVEH
jgi:hypothetical protein